MGTPPEGYSSMAGAVGPVFVAGCPRSGTSALSWAIAAHPLYWTSVETHYLYYLLRDRFLMDVYARSCVNGSWLEVHSVSPEEFLRHLGVGLDQMMRTRSGGLQWVDGSPENLLVGKELLTMYPEAQIIQVVRDPIEVCLSMMASGFGEAWASDLETAIQTWCHYAKVGLKLALTYPDHVLVVRHSDMIHNRQTVATKLGRRLRLDGVEEISRFLATTKVNSSFDPNSYVESSPYRPSSGAVREPTEFLDRYGSVIAAATTELLAAFDQFCLSDQGFRS
jgi:Sulfotransferase family